MGNTKFYGFTQNNSGGSFVENESLCHRLFIEAESLGEAIDKAEELGCYWGGVEAGIDCPCCGDRWDTYCIEYTFPFKFSSKVTFNTIEEAAQYLANNYISWTKPDGRIFYLDGSVKEIETEN